VTNFNIIGIDPGSNMGVSILTLDQSLNITGLEVLTIKANINLNVDQDLVDLHTARFYRLKEQKKRLINLFMVNMPIIVACESPYFNSRMPTAFESLVEMISNIKTALTEYNDFMELFKIDPSTIKKTVGANGIAKKEAIKLAVGKLNMVKTYINDFDDLDEHSIDSIAVVYTLYKRVLLNNRGFAYVG